MRYVLSGTDWSHTILFMIVLLEIVSVCVSVDVCILLQ